MAAHWVYTCDGTKGENSIALSSNVYPVCSPASAGQWVQVDIPEPFDVSTITAQQVTEAFAAGFTVMGIPLCAVVGVLLVLKLIRH